MFFNTSNQVKTATSLLQDVRKDDSGMENNFIMVG